MSHLTTEQLFWKKVQKTDACWLWTAAIGKKGFGMFNIPREGRCWLPVFAHRFSWELSFGKIPAVAHVVSTCRNKLCVNPEHLYLETTTEQKFWRKVKKTDSCWVWTGATYDFGYGAFRYPKNGRLVNSAAHRFSMDLHHGPIPEGTFVLHRCDNPACVNPDHLFLGTQKDNMVDMRNKGRGYMKPGEDHPNAKLTADDVRRIRAAHAAGETYRSLAKQFSVTLSHIGHIASRQNWKNLEQ